MLLKDIKPKPVLRNIELLKITNKKLEEFPDLATLRKFITKEKRKLWHENNPDYYKEFYQNNKEEMCKRERDRYQRKKQNKQA